MPWPGGPYSAAPDPASLGSNHSSGVFFSDKTNNAVEQINFSALRVRVDGAKSLIVDQAHPALASGKLAVLKRLPWLVGRRAIAN